MMLTQLNRMNADLLRINSKMLDETREQRGMKMEPMRISKINRVALALETPVNIVSVKFRCASPLADRG